MSEPTAENSRLIGPGSGTGEPESIGAMLQRLRESAGRSQSDQAFILSDISGRPVTRNDISRWENEGRLIGQIWQSAFAESFGVSENQLRRAVVHARSERRKQGDKHWTKRSSVETIDSDALVGDLAPDMPADIQAYVPVLRGALDLYDAPEDGPVPSLRDLRTRTARLVRWRLNSEYVTLATELQAALPELTRALFTYQANARAEVASLLVQAYRAADSIVDKFGLYDLSARTIGIIDWAARQADSPTTVAISAYVRGETFFASQQYSPGRRVLEKAAEGLRLSGSPGESAAFGALHMRAAVLAARAGQVDYARDHLRAARDAADQVDEGVFGGTAFGPSSVRIHEVSLAVDLDDPTGALAAAAGWEPADSLPAERRSHFYVDLARAQLLTGRHDHVLRSLHRAWTIAPQHIRAHPHVHAMLPDLTAQGGTNASSTREFCRSANIILAN
jgi:transcriptional regulator with XRE-family HTH domain